MNLIPTRFVQCLLAGGWAIVATANADELLLPSPVVIPLAGQVSVQREGSRQPSKVIGPTPVKRGDMLRLSVGASAEVMCRDLSVHAISDAAYIPCTDPEAGWLVDRTISSLRGNASRGAPIRSPLGKILQRRPEIRWQELADVQRYHVELRSYDGVVWKQDEVRGDHLSYPVNEPPLYPKMTYWAVVTKAGQSASAEPSFGQTFQVADDALQLRAEQLARRLKATLPAPAAALVLAQAYAAWNLFDAACSEIEHGVPNGDRLYGAGALLEARVLGQIGRLAEARAALTRAKPLIPNDALEDSQVLERLERQLAGR